MLPLNENAQQRKSKSAEDELFDPKKVKNTANGFVVFTLYLRSLGKQIRHEHLVHHFSSFGKVRNVRIHKKSSHSFGFVTFTQPESAAKALAAPVHIICGREQSVTMVDCWHDENQEQPLSICSSYQDGAAPSTSECKSPIESTEENGIHLLDHKDDYLLCSVDETCTQFKHIAVRLFRSN